MKRITMKKAALLAAAVMAVSATGIAAEAKGWTETEGGKKYTLSNGNEAASGKYNIGGVVYDFSEEGYCLGEFSGWAKSGGVNRRYNKGVPYTGWLQNKDGQKRYCLDGYLVKNGDIQIGSTSYKFNDKGYLCGETGLSISASVGNGKVSADTTVLTVKLEKLTDGMESFGALAMLERWEKGQWVDCFAELDGAVPSTMELYSMSQKGETLEMPFYTIERLGYKLTPGFYRIPINNVADSGFMFTVPIAVLDSETGTPVLAEAVQTDPAAEHVNSYAMFKVV